MASGHRGKGMPFSKSLISNSWRGGLGGGEREIPPYRSGGKGNGDCVTIRHQVSNSSPKAPGEGGEGGG